MPGTRISISFQKSLAFARERGFEAAALADVATVAKLQRWVTAMANAETDAVEKTAALADITALFAELNALATA